MQYNFISIIIHLKCLYKSSKQNQVYLISLHLLEHSHIQVFCDAQKRSLTKSTKIQYPGLWSVKHIQILYGCDKAEAVALHGFQVHDGCSLNSAEDFRSEKSERGPFCLPQRESRMRPGSEINPCLSQFCS